MNAKSAGRQDILFAVVREEKCFGADTRRPELRVRRSSSRALANRLHKKEHVDRSNRRSGISSGCTRNAPHSYWKPESTDSSVSATPGVLRIPADPAEIQKSMSGRIRAVPSPARRSPRDRSESHRSKSRRVHNGESRFRPRGLLQTARGKSSNWHARLRRPKSKLKSIKTLPRSNKIASIFTLES